MKNKILNLFIFAGAVVLIGLIIFIAISEVQFGTLWVKYSILGCLLVIFLCLNLKFKKYSDYDETVSCVKRARKSVAKINSDNGINYVKQLTITNQLTNAELLLDEFIARHESYFLKDNLASLREIKPSFKTADDTKLRLPKETVLSALQILDGILDEMRKMKGE